MLFRSHVAGAVVAFMGLEYVLLDSPVAGWMLSALGAGKLAMLAVFLGFMGVTGLARWMADRAEGLPMQYAGLGLYVVAEALLFLPLLHLASRFSGPAVIPAAAAITGALFLGLTFVAFTTRKDFSFLGTILKVGGFVALGLIVASIAFGFQLGMLFSAVMVLFAAGAILYSTSNIMFRYGAGQHVAAALDLFASVMLLFWYVLRLLMGSRRS